MTTEQITAMAELEQACAIQSDLKAKYWKGYQTETGYKKEIQLALWGTANQNVNDLVRVINMLRHLWNA